MITSAPSQTGFSLIELITVIILLGIISVVALGRINVTGFEEKAYQTELITAIRYTQKIAVANNCYAQIVINNSGLAIQQPTTPTDCTAPTSFINVVNPSTGAAYQVTQPSGVSITPTPIIGFQADGSAITNLTFTPPSGAIVSIDLSLSINGTLSTHICVSSTSGYTFLSEAICP